MPSLKL